MSRVCEICGKHPQTGNTISHAHNVNKRKFNPNIRNVKTKVSGNTVTTKVCMKCLKATAVI